VVTSNSNDTRNEANGGKPEGAIDTAAELAKLDDEGTPGKDATVQTGKDSEEEDDEEETSEDSESNKDSDSEGKPKGKSKEDEPEGDEELKHSEGTLTAAKELADSEGYNRRLKEEKTDRDNRYESLAKLVKAERGELPAVTRAIKNAFAKLPELTEGQKYTDDDFEPIMKTIKDALDIAPDAAMMLAGERYEASINRLFDDDKARDEFWKAAELIDPAFQVDKILPLLIDMKALDSAAVKDADPETLINANPKLKLHFKSEKDAAKKLGRDLGRKDPNPERRGGSDQSVTRSGYPRDDDGKIDTRRALASIN